MIANRPYLLLLVVVWLDTRRRRAVRNGGRHRKTSATAYRWLAATMVTIAEKEAKLAARKPRWLPRPNFPSLTELPPLTEIPIVTTTVTALGFRDVFDPTPTLTAMKPVTV